ncbi:MAG: cysteine hydrolase family protein [Steroidobacter sp.]
MSCPALIIIDMQQGMRWPSSGVRNNPDAESNIEKLLAHWRKLRAPVVHLHHRSRTPGSPFHPDQPGIEVQPVFTPHEGEHVMEKNTPDAFINGNLAQWLRTHHIDAVVIVGVSTNNSVEATARTAGNLCFKTYVIADACFAFAKKDFDGVQRTAQEVHAMSLANLDGEYATVIQSADAVRLMWETKPDCSQ